MGTLLDRLMIKEISGVDEPANEAPGWIVIKAKEGASEEELLAEVEEIHRAHGALLEAIMNSLDYLEDAPEEVKEAVVVLVKYLRQLGEDPEAPEGEGGGEDEDVEYSKTQSWRERIRRWMGMGKDESEVELDPEEASIVVAIQFATAKSGIAEEINRLRFARDGQPQ